MRSLLSLGTNSGCPLFYEMPRSSSWSRTMRATNFLAKCKESTSLGHRKRGHMRLLISCGKTAGVCCFENSTLAATPRYDLFNLFTIGRGLHPRSHKVQGYQLVLRFPFVSFRKAASLSFLAVTANVLTKVLYLYFIQPSIKNIAACLNLVDLFCTLRL